MRRLLGWIVLFVLPLVTIADGRAEPVTTHPRLWVTASDLPRLRTWAVPTNPVYQQGLRQLALQSAQRMDEGDIPGDDNAGTTWSPVNTEEYAALFALMALVDPDPVARAGWAQRSRTLLLHVVGSVDTCMRALPPTENGDYCDIAFSVSDRSRWTGAAFGLTADWLQATTNASGQPTLSTSDRALLRRVFLMWSNLNLEAYPNPYNNPPEYSLPVGTIGTPLLRLDQDLRRHRLRFSGNNYFAGHMRNMGLMALAIDPADDVHDPLAPSTYLRLNGSGNVVAVPFDDSDGRLRGFLRDVLGGWLFVQDYLLRNDSRGGLPLEGMEYAPTSIGIPAQFLFALETAGYGDLAAQAQWGAHVAGLSTNPFYRAAIDGFIHSQSPVPSASGFGLVYRPAWYGDGEHYYQNDPIDILGPLALHAMRIGDQVGVDAIRWVQRFVPPDGNAGFVSRTRANGSSGDVLSSLMYFLVFDPAQASSSASAPDPRPSFATSFWSDGMGRLLSRSDWGAAARWFAFRLSWNSVDHQHGDGGMFEFYRQGEWLTKGALGYGNEGGATDYKNMLTVQNTIGAGVDLDGYLGRRLVRGAQMPQNRAQGDPVMLSRSEDARYSHVGGDATALYNAHYPAGDSTPAAQRATDVQHVSRSVLWVKPDHVVVYDRARTATAGRAKRFWLNLPDRLPSQPQIAGDLVSATTPGGQRLFVRRVLPAASTMTIVTTDPGISPQAGNLWSLGDEDPLIQERTVANGGNPYTESYATRLRVEADGAPLDARFLHVLQGTNAGAGADAATAIASTAFAGCATPAGAFDGVAFGSRSVLFAHDVTPLRNCVQYSVAAAIAEHYVVGLAPYTAYDVARTIVGAQQRITLTPGGAWQTDAGGVLRYEAGITPPASAIAVFDATDVDYGVAPIGTAAQRTVTLTNRGNAALTSLAFGLSGATEFAAVGGSCVTPATTLAPGQSCTLQLDFVPVATGYRRATLALSSSAATPPSPLPLRGVGEPSTDAIFADGFE